MLPPWEKCLMSGPACHGFRLMLQDNEGQYANSAHTLKFEGSMLIYDPQCNIAQWVPVWGASASLTMMELCTVNDLKQYGAFTL